jgi:hypothetical protein
MPHHTVKSLPAFIKGLMVVVLVPCFFYAHSLRGVTLRAQESEPTPDQFDKLRALIKPHADEDRWAEIPWTANLWEARQRATALGKPILLWEMDGNPLGCG